MRVITGSARGKRLVAPEGFDIRPTTDNVKEALFNVIQFDIEGRRILDLFAGTGQLGIECLSRGASEVVFVDHSRVAVNAIKDNLKRCGFNAPVLQTNALTYLCGCGKFDVILVDPPYASGLYTPVLEQIGSVDILNEGGIIICESSTDAVLPEMSSPYSKTKEYRHGKVRLTKYTRE